MLTHWLERRPGQGEVNSPRKDSGRREWTEERDLRHDLERKKERDLRENLKMQQRQRELEKKQHEERRRWEDAYTSREKEGEYGYAPHYPNARRRGYYVCKPRQNNAEYGGETALMPPPPDSRKRRPRQVWKPKDGGDSLDRHDSVIRGHKTEVNFSL